MTRNDFNALMAEIAALYGKPPASVELIWRIMEPLSTQQARQVADAVMSKHHRMPAPAAFKAEAQPFLAGVSMVRRQAKAAETADCFVCGGSGMMVALLRSQPCYEFSFACPACPAAAQLGYNKLPAWTDEHEKRYIKTSLRPESHKAAQQARTYGFSTIYGARDNAQRKE